MQKIKSAAILILCYLVLPLSGNPVLLLHWKPLFVLAACLFIWFTQPAISIEEAKAKRDSDKNTVLLIVAFSGIAIVAPLIEWAYFSGADWNGNLIPTIAGLLMVIGGTALRHWSIQTLGRYFTATVQVQGEQNLITTGPYSIVRHPSYLGSFITFVGCGIFLNAFLGAFIAALSMGIAYYLRISAEEKTLLEAFGDMYRQYQQRTKRMMPGLW